MWIYNKQHKSQLQTRSSQLSIIPDTDLSADEYRLKQLHAGSSGQPALFTHPLVIPSRITTRKAWPRVESDVSERECNFN